MSLSDFLKAHPRLLWLVPTLVLSSITAALHLYATEHFWYWVYRWFDIPMHILGSATIASFFIAIFPTRRPFLFLAAIAAIAIGWEAMEYVAGITRNEAGYWLDTSQDLLDDAIGATLAYIAARLTVWRSN